MVCKLLDVFLSPKCRFRFSSYESTEILDLTVVKRDGSKKIYNRDKLIRGLKRSLEKRPITEDKFKKLIGSIERDLQVLRKAEVTSSRVGQIIMKHLRKIDQIAYIRLASVYQAFDNIETFRKELDKLAKRI